MTTPVRGIEIFNYLNSENSGFTSPRIVIVSFNIRYAVGSFLISGSLLRKVGISRPSRRQHLIEQHLSRAAEDFSKGALLPSPDIIALQEADKETHRAGRHHIARELAVKMKMAGVHAALKLPRDEAPKPKQWYLNFEEPIETTDQGDTGLAVLSKIPFARAERLELPWADCAWRPRLALAMTYRTAHGDLHLINAHIDPHANVTEQLDQHRAILDYTKNLTGTIVLLGDFNTLTKRSCIEMRRLLEANEFYTPFPMGTKTWRAGLIRLQTDWIFLRGASVSRFGVARPFTVSDHWPIWVEIDLSEPPAIAGG